MARQNETTTKKKRIEQYDHKGKKRTNNPPVGLVDAKSDALEGKKTYSYDPHLDPTLVWAGKAERTSFEIPTVSLHVHERIEKTLGGDGGSHYNQVELQDGTIRPLTDEERLKPSLLPMGAKVFQTTSLTSDGAQSGEGCFEFGGKNYSPPPHKHWSCSVGGLKRVAKARRIVPTPTTIRYKHYFDDLPAMASDNRWDDVGMMLVFSASQFTSFKLGSSQSNAASL